MEEERSAFVRRGNLDPISGLVDANVVSCRWVFTIKDNPNGIINRYIAQLAACGFS